MVFVLRDTTRRRGWNHEPTTRLPFLVFFCKLRVAQIARWCVPSHILFCGREKQMCTDFVIKSILNSIRSRALTVLKTGE